MGKQFTLYLAEPCQESKIKLLQSLTTFAKGFILDVCQGFKCASVQEIAKTNKPNKAKKNQDMNYISILETVEIP